MRRRSPASLPFDGKRDEHGRRLCCHCGAVLNGRRRRWCSDECVEDWLIKSGDQGAARREVIDGGWRDAAAQHDVDDIIERIDDPRLADLDPSAWEFCAIDESQVREGWFRIRFPDRTAYVEVEPDYDWTGDGWRDCSTYVVREVAANPRRTQRGE